MNKYKDSNYHKKYYKKHKKRMIKQIRENNKKPKYKKRRKEYNKKYRKTHKKYFKEYKKQHKEEHEEYAREYYLKKSKGKNNIYKIIIFDLKKIENNTQNSGMRSTIIKSKYKIENFKRKIERYFGKKGV